MTRVRIALCLPLLITCSACSALNYPTGSDASEGSTTQSQQAPSAPVLVGLGFGVPENDLAETPEESAQKWSELTRRARLDRQAGRFEEAREALEQAAAQLSHRPPANAQRRAVFGMRARLAIDFVALEEDENADALADQLFDEATREPELGGPALVDLAFLFAQRRGAEARQAGLPDSQLPLFRLALQASESEPASRNRLSLAYDISEAATRAGDHELARRAIDRAVLDAQTVEPADRDQLASLKIFKARIAMAQGDLVTAEASAVAANRIFEEIGAPSANRAVAEATLARALGEAGEIERARAIAIGAQARLDADPPLPIHASRIVLAELARLERAAGDLDAARAQFEAALALPPLNFAQDAALISRLTQELAALDSTPEEDSILVEQEDELHESHK